MPEVPRGRSHHWGSETINCSVDLPVVSFVEEKEPQLLSSKGSVSIRAATLASEKERREVVSESPHPGDAQACTDEPPGAP